MEDEDEIKDRWQKGGLPCAGNSSDHIYLCVEYKMDEEAEKKNGQNSYFNTPYVRRTRVKAEENSALEESQKENKMLTELVNRLEKAAAANAAPGTTAGTP